MPSGEILKQKKKSLYRMCIYRIIKDLHAFITPQDVCVTQKSVRCPLPGG